MTQGAEHGLHQARIAGLALGPVENHADAGPGLVAPIVGKGVGSGLHHGHQGWLPQPEPLKAAQHLALIGGAALPHAARQRLGEVGRGVTQFRQGVFLLGRARQHQQGPTFRAPAPGLKALEAVAPVPPAAQESHQHHCCFRKGGGHVVVDHGGMAQGRQVQGPQGACDQLRFVLQQGRHGGQIRIGAAEEHHLGSLLLHEGQGAISGFRGAGNRGKSVHGHHPGVRSEKIAASAPLSMHQFLPYAWFGGSCVPFAEATLSVATHALHYGTGAFGGMRGLPNPDDPGEVLLFRVDRHARRLTQSARLLLTELSEETVLAAIGAFLQANKPRKPFYLRPFVYTCGLGISPRLHDVETDFLIYGIEMGDYLSPEGVTCRFSSWTRQEDRSLPLRGKISGAYITSSLAKTEAVKSGFDEALLLNSRGKVSEASGMNLFIVRDGVLITPSVDQDILEGITRASILELARAMDIPVLERPVDKTELFVADEAFLSGTAARVTPIRRLESTDLPNRRPVMEKLRDRLTAITEGRDSVYEHWVTRIRIDA